MMIDALLKSYREKASIGQRSISFTQRVRRLAKRQRIRSSRTARELSMEAGSLQGGYGFLLRISLPPMLARCSRIRRLQ